LLLSPGAGGPVRANFPVVIGCAALLLGGCAIVRHAPAGDPTDSRSGAKSKTAPTGKPPASKGRTPLPGASDSATVFNHPDPSEVPPQVPRIYADGVAAHRAGRFDEALHDWEQVWKLAPGFEDVEEKLMKEYLVRGLESFARGSLDEAIGSWEKARGIRPDDPRVLAYLERAKEQRERQAPPR